MCHGLQPRQTVTHCDTTLTCRRASSIPSLGILEAQAQRSTPGLVRRVQSICKEVH